MKTLNTLIRMHKGTLDELRRKMTSLETQKSQLQLAIKNSQQELQDEIALGSKQPEMANFFGEFAKRIKTRQEVLRKEIRELDKQIAALNIEINEAYSELKKIEVAKEQKMERQRLDANRKETNELDEIAGQQHSRKEH